MSKPHVKSIRPDLYRRVPEEVLRKAADIFDKDCWLAVAWDTGIRPLIRISRGSAEEPDFMYKHFRGYRTTDDDGIHWYNLQSGALIAFFNAILPYLSRRKDEAVLILRLKASADRDFRREFDGDIKEYRKELMLRVKKLNFERMRGEKWVDGVSYVKVVRKKRSNITPVPENKVSQDDCSFAAFLMDDDCRVYCNEGKSFGVKVSFVRDEEEDIEFLHARFGGLKVNAETSEGVKLYWLTFYGDVLVNFISHVRPYTSKFKKEIGWILELHNLIEGRTRKGKVTDEELRERRILGDRINFHWKSKKI